MVKGWIQHVNGKVVRGVGVPPTDGDYYLISDVPEETVAVIGGELRVGGRKVKAHMVTLKNGETLSFVIDARGKLKRTDEKAGKR